MTIQLSSPIAEGRTAVVYAWDDSHILKLFRDWCPPNWVDYEARIAHAVYEAGVPSPAAGEIIEVDGRRGLIYERLEGRSMLQDMNARPWRLLKYARQLAELQIQIHRQSIPELPSYKGRLDHDIRNVKHLSEDLREKSLAMLATLPDGQSLCHGDFHPGNILITPRGPVVIDWMTACAGVPAADAARTHLLLTVGPKAAGNLINPLIKWAIGSYYQAYRNHYHSLVPDMQQQVKCWLSVMAAARLNEDIHPERMSLLEIVREGLETCVYSKDGDTDPA